MNTRRSNNWRLTERDEHGDLYVKQHDYVRAAARLAEYEDTGLTPEEIMDGKMLTGWIPVKERLPSSGSHVLATFDDGFVATVSYGGIDEDWELWADSGEVIAWMPLPEPYQPPETMECPHLEIDEFGEAICHSEGNCPQDYAADCPVDIEGDCPGICAQCNHQWDCENSDRLDGLFQEGQP